MAKGTHVAAFCAALSMIAGTVPAALAQPTPDAPDKVLNAVKNGPHAKIGPWLSYLYEEYREASGRGGTAKNFKSRMPMLRVANGKVGVDAFATNRVALVDALRSLGATKIRARGPLVSAQVPVKSLGALAALASLRSARPVLATTNVLPDKAVSQGDVSLNGPAARETAGVDGSGVTVGALSDSFACNPDAFVAGAPTSTFAEDLSNDELPAVTTILDNGPCPGADEGRGMAQLIHDVARPVPRFRSTRRSTASSISPRASSSWPRPLPM
ncbi:MAG: hypothetical protein ACRES3_06385 [Steroidobacteraceae bacterium]